MKKMRKSSNFFEGSSKALKERGIVTELIKSMQRSGEPLYSNPTSCSDQWPDVIAEDQHAGKVALEVTELVDEYCVKENQKGNGIYCIWTPEQVCGEIERILSKKNLKSNHGGKYKGVALVIHTDELVIEPEKYVPLLKARHFARPININEAYVLFSYDPHTKTYPYVRLTWKPPLSNIQLLLIRMSQVMKNLRARLSAPRRV